RRKVSPQRITHYRDNWYLDAWDHEREALRSFAVDRISQARLLDEPAHDVEDGVLDQHFASSYGIFSGEPKGWATIVFSPKVARWVADEHWHSRQQGRFLPDGRYELKVPYSVSRELLMDVLHYGADAEIVEPAVLREQAKSLLSLALAQYDRWGGGHASLFLPGIGEGPGNPAPAGARKKRNSGLPGRGHRLQHCPQSRCASVGPGSDRCGWSPALAPDLPAGGGGTPSQPVRWPPGNLRLPTRSRSHVELVAYPRRRPPPTRSGWGSGI